MKKILDSLTSNFIIVIWTIWYFFIIWFLLKFLFNFDMFSYHYWWKFFHSTLHGFSGFVFGSLVYAAIPLYIATTIITYRKKELLIPIPFKDTISKIISNIFHKKPEEIVQPETVSEEVKVEDIKKPEFPEDLPPELRIPYTRVKNRMSLTGSVSVYNQPNKNTKTISKEENLSENPDIPIPMDFDMSDTFEQKINDSVPHFTDIDFDVPIATEKELENNTTKYFEQEHIDYETYHDFIATKKFVIYEHNDEDFWIMDGDSWFAAGKQKDSPIQELIGLAKQNELTPVLYLASQNIMDLDNTISNFESMGIRVVKDLSELD